MFHAAIIRNAEWKNNRFVSCTGRFMKIESTHLPPLLFKSVVLKTVVFMKSVLRVLHGQTVSLMGVTSDIHHSSMPSYKMST